MTDEELTAMRERCERVPPRMLEVMIHGNNAGFSVVKVGPVRWQEVLCILNDEDDAFLFAHARADIAALLAEVARLRDMVRSQPEWTPRLSGPVPAKQFCCIWCEHSALEGHAPDCQRQLALGVTP
jgi:hypothetical protein